MSAARTNASDWLETEDAEAQRILIQAEEREIYLQPQRVLGFRDLVTRPLGVQLNSLGVYTGASLQSDGSQIMILDATRLLRRSDSLISHNSGSATGRADSSYVEARQAWQVTDQQQTGNKSGNKSGNKLGNRADLTTAEYRHFVDEIDFDSTDANASSSWSVAEDTNVSDTAGNSILIVDDSVTLRTYTCGIVQNNGLSTIEARDGHEALEALKRMSLSPAAMVVDIEMPRMDGFTLVDALRKIDRYKKLPVIMISSRSGTYNRLRARELGVHGFLGKPYREKDLLRLLRQLQLVQADSVPALEEETATD